MFLSCFPRVARFWEPGMGENGKGNILIIKHSKQWMGNTSSKSFLIVYLKFKCNWVSSNPTSWYSTFILLWPWLAWAGEIFAWMDVGRSLVYVFLPRIGLEPLLEEWCPFHSWKKNGIGISFPMFGKHWSKPFNNSLEYKWMST